MLHADFHTHTSFSTDCEASPEAMLTSAIQKGLTHYCITDHFDLAWPKHPQEFIFDPTMYMEYLLSLRERYTKQIHLQIGIELGLRNEPEKKQTIREQLTALCAAYPFDCILGSTHVLENSDPYDASFWETRTGVKGLLSYFHAVLENTEYYDCFTVCAHLDYIARYLPEDTVYRPSDHTDLTDEILRLLIVRGKGLEVNTSAFRNGKAPNPHPLILKRYLELGGEILTVGSDAHTPSAVAQHFAEAEDLLCSLGYRYYTTFKRQIPQFHRLGN